MPTIFDNFDAASWSWEHLSRLWTVQDGNLASTLVLIVGALLLRWVINLWLARHTEFSHYTVMRWRHRLRYMVLIFILVAILVIWAPQLRAFAVSIVAVAAALVLAFKELITCLTGSIIRASVEGARLGGRLELNDVRGDVAATNILSTTVLEVNENGQRTGRTIVLPNSLFLTKNAITITDDDRRYVLLLATIPLNREDDWQEAERLLLAIGNEVISPYLKDAKKHFARFDRKYGFNAPGPEPKVLIDWKEADKIELGLRMAVPVSEQNAVRQRVLREVLAGMKKSA